MRAERVQHPDTIRVSDGTSTLTVRCADRGDKSSWEFCVTGSLTTFTLHGIKNAIAARDMLIAAIADYEQKGPRT